MTVDELVRAVERRAMDRDKTVVVEINKNGGLVEVDGVRFGHGKLIVLTLWRPR